MANPQISMVELYPVESRVNSSQNRVDPAESRVNSLQNRVNSVASRDNSVATRANPLATRANPPENRAENSGPLLPDTKRRIFGVRQVPPLVVQADMIKCVTTSPSLRLMRKTFQKVFQSGFVSSLRAAILALRQS